jgi:hypothetical protein
MKTKDWLNHFETNHSNVLAIKPDTYRLTDDERSRITSSIQSFQLGESSEGHILREQARTYSEQIDRPEYLRSIEHLIKEENRHSSYLLSFMRVHKIPQLRRGWNDSCFRFLRRLAGIEQSARVLVTAEIIAMTYYSCLGSATQSPVLKEICQRMCDEEKSHVSFQMQHIHEMNFRKHGLLGALANLAHFVLLLTALLFVWTEHRQVLRSQHTFKSFVKKVCRDFIEVNYEGQLSAAQTLVDEGYLSKEALCTPAHQ